jgi:transcriptional regulator with XRE-family HTH domain
MGASTPSAFGALLREWRALRGASQLALALEAGTSTRHVSFLETGRAGPSREMVLRLADALDVPLRERNALLEAAGFASLYRESALEAADLGPIRRVIALLLEAAEPFPAAVVDRAYDVVLANGALGRVFGRLIEPADFAALGREPDPRDLPPARAPLRRELERGGAAPARPAAARGAAHSARRPSPRADREVLGYPGVERAWGAPPRAPAAAGGGAARARRARGARVRDHHHPRDAPGRDAPGAPHRVVPAGRRRREELARRLAAEDAAAR